jgi:urea transport system permease protein
MFVAAWRFGLSCVACLVAFACVGAMSAQAADGVAGVSRAAAIAAFCGDGDSPAAGQPMTGLAAIVSVGASGDADAQQWARRVVEALREGSFACTTGGAARLGGTTPVDAVTLAPVVSSDHQGDATPSAYVPGIALMRKLAVAAAEIDLSSGDRETRAAAAAQIDKFFMLLDPQLVDAAAHRERDARIAATLRLALAKRGLTSAVESEQLQAIHAVAAVPSETARTALQNFVAQESVRHEPAVLAAAQAAIRNMDTWLSFGSGLSVLFSGVSYAGVLLITALGLSIVFGLMGVINLAHGEFIMFGAYATYLVERFLEAHCPALFDAYVFIAIPVAFVMCAVCGMVLEYCVIRFLYRRPLETLLATWAVSIALIKLVQVVFGSQNVEFVTPGFLNGGMQVLPGFFVTYNRVFAIAFAALIFGGTFALLRFTKLGLLMRATTQLRDMARALGVPAERIDRLAFGLGAGLAGLAGVVLTQITTVNPSMGTGFVVDSFMVVVLGGAGSLVGTLVSSLALGEINQFIEPFYGAVAAKVAVLLIIVVIIQRRPQGLFALKTRT